MPGALVSLEQIVEVGIGYHGQARQLLRYSLQGCPLGAAYLDEDVTFAGFATSNFAMASSSDDIRFHART